MESKTIKKKTEGLVEEFTPLKTGEKKVKSEIYTKNNEQKN